MGYFKQKQKWLLWSLHYNQDFFRPITDITNHVLPGTGTDLGMQRGHRMDLRLSKASQLGNTASFPIFHQETLRETTATP